MKHLVYGISDIGRVHQHNEDAMLMDERLGLYVVCDGCGGRSAGEIASNLAIKTIQEFLEDHHDSLEICRKEATLFHRGEAVKLVRAAIQTANDAVFSAAAADPEKHGMACTVVLVLMLGRHAVVASAGDSRIYLFRTGGCFQLTEDHTVAAEYLKKGLITVEQAQNNRRSFLITRAIGSGPMLEPDVLFIELMSDDCLLLCSDGLTGDVTDKEILSIALETSADQLPARLVALSNERGGRDNITAVVVRANDPDPKADGEVSGKLDVLRQVPMFEHLSFKELIRLLNAADVRFFDEGEQIIREGDEDCSLFVILSGGVRVEKDGKVFAELGSIDVFGEMSLIDNKPRSADVIATKFCRLFVLDRLGMFGLLNSEPRLAMKLLWPMCRILNKRLRHTSEEFVWAQSHPEDHVSDEAIDALRTLADD
jgi:serine/threonine protein phosphatase PrpC